MSIFNLSLLKKPQAESSAPVASDDTSAVAQTTGEPTDNEDKESVVVLDGPLSHVYTKALNLVYAREGMMSMLTYDEVDNKSKAQKGTYVYCHPNTLTSVSQVNSLSGKLNLVVAGKKYSNVYLVLECQEGTNKYTQLLDEYARSIGVEVFYHRETGIKQIRTALESGVK